MNEPSSLSWFSPIWGNTRFAPGNADGGFRLWAEKGVGQLKDMFGSYNGNFLSFEELVSKYDIPRKKFFKYLQLRRFVRANQDRLMLAPPLSILEKVLIKKPFGKGIISEFYDLLLAFSPESSNSRLNAWKTDLQEDLTLEQWSTACKAAQTQTGNTRLKLLQYKWLMRVYITPEKLNTFNANIPDTCTRCGEEKGTLFHCLWLCPRIKEFWEEVRVTVQNILLISLKLEPKMFLLGLYPDGHNIQRYEHVFIDIRLLQAKRAIALTWKKLGKSSIAQWFRELSLCLPLEKITYILKDNHELFQKVWGRFIQYTKNNNLSQFLNEPGAG